MTQQFKVFKSNGVLAAYVNSIEEALSSCDRNKDWYFEKKGKLTKEEINYKVVRDCINKELEPFAFTYDDVKKEGQFENCSYMEVVDKTRFFGLWKYQVLETKSKPWFQFFTFNSKEEYESWKEFCINLFRKELKMSKKAAEVEFSWFDLSFGLKQNYEVKI